MGRYYQMPTSLYVNPSIFITKPLHTRVNKGQYMQEGQYRLDRSSAKPTGWPCEYNQPFVVFIIPEPRCHQLAQITDNAECRGGYRKLCENQGLEFK